MRIRKLTALLAAFVLLTAASAKEGKKQEKKELSNTRIASCLVKVTCDPAALPLSFDTVERLLHSSGVGAKAIREILEIPMLTDETEELVHFGIEPLSKEPKDMSKGIEFDEEYMRAFEALGRKKKPVTTKRSLRLKGIVGDEALIGGVFRKVGDNVAGAKILEIGPTYVKLEGQGQQTLFFRLEVGLAQEVKPAAEEFMKALTDNLRKTLDAVCDDYRTKLDQRFRLARGDAERAEKDLARLQEKLREILGIYNLERQAILDDITRSRKNLQATQMELETSEAFIQATSNRIVETEAKMNDKINTDPVLAELQKIVKIHQERVSKLMKKGSQTELSQARELLLRAKIELAQRREEIRQSAGGNLIDSLRNQISELTIEQAQARKRIHHLGQQLGTAEHLLVKADEYERFSLRVKIAKQAFEDALLLHSRMKRKSFLSLLVQPSVFVLGAD